MARRKQRSRKSTYKRRVKYNNRDRSSEIEPAPVRTITVDDLPEDSALRRLAEDSNDND